MKIEWTQEQFQFYFYRQVRDDISLPALQTIPEGYFKGWKFGKLKVPSEVKEIPKEAFAECMRLETVHLEKGIRKIGREAFRGCKFLLQVYIPETVEVIEAGAFADCIRLREVVIDREEDRISIEKDVFQRCFCLSEIGFKKGAGSNNDKKSHDMGYTISNIMSMGLLSLFDKPSKIRPRPVQEKECAQEDETVDFEDLEITAAYGLPGNLSRKTGLSGKVKFSNSTFGDPLYGKCKKGYYTITGDKGQRQQSLDEPGYRFYSGSRDKMCEIEMKDQEIGQGAFCGCQELETVRIAEGVKRIHRFAFAQCSNLRTVYYPMSLEQVDEYAFADCINLENFYPAISGTPEKTFHSDERAFERCHSISFHRHFDKQVRDDISLPALPRIPEGYFKGWKFGKLDIPGEVGEIPKEAFAKCMRLETVHLEKGIRKIGQEAFRGCKFLLQVYIPETVEIIEAGAFTDCIRLREVAIDREQSRITIEKDVFQRCFSLNQIGFKKGVGSNNGEKKKDIGYTIFNIMSLGLLSLADKTSKIPPKPVQEKEKEKEKECAQEDETVDFEELEITAAYGLPEKLYRKTGLSGKVKFSNSTFEDPLYGKCKKGYYIITGDKGQRQQSLDEPGYRFYSDSQDKMCEIEMKDQEIGQGAFCGCQELETVRIAEGVKRIHRFAFAQCRNLRTVYYPMSLEQVDEYAFADCINLENFYPALSGTREKTFHSDEHAFERCYSISFQRHIDEYECERGEDGDLWITKYTGNKTQVCVPDKIYGIPVMGIRKSAFSGNKEITHLYLCAQVPCLEPGAFEGMTGLKEFMIPGVLESRDAGGELTLQGYQFCAGQGGCLDFENLRVDIAYGAKGAYYFKMDTTGRIEFSDYFMKYTEAAGYGREGYYRLSRKRNERFTNQDSDRTLKGISRCLTEGLFAGDTSLTEIRLMEDNTQLPKRLFYNCTGLCRVDFNGKKAGISDECFSGCKKLIALYNDDGLLSVGESAFRDCEALRYTVLPQTMTKIPDGCFRGCKSMAICHIPEHITSIGDNAFAESGIQMVFGGNESLAVGKKAFRDCTALKTVAVPRDCSRIAPDAFEGCGGIKAIVLPSDIPELGAEELLFLKGGKDIQIQGSIFPHITESAIEYLESGRILCGEDMAEEAQEKLNEYKRKYRVECGLAAGDIQDNFLYEFDGDGVWIEYYVGSQKRVTIPEQIQGKDVIGIKQRAFYRNPVVEEIWCPDTVEEIQEEAFCGCRSLTYTRLPKKLLRLGKDVWTGCTSLRWIVLPGGETKAWDRLPKGEEWGSLRFSLSDGRVTDNSRRTIQTAAEQDARFTFEIREQEAVLRKYKAIEEPEVREAELPEVVKGIPVRIIGESAFAGTKGLTEIRLPWYTQEVLREAFWGCRRMEKFLCNPGLKHLRSYAVGNCENLKFVYVRSDNITLENKAFSQCVKLEAVTFECMKLKADTDAWKDCPGLKNLWFRKFTPKWKDEVKGLSGFQIYFARDLTLPERTTLRIETEPEWNQSFQGVQEDAGITLWRYEGKEQEIIIPPYYRGLPVTGLKEGLFAGHKEICSVQLPDSVENIGPRVFYNCSALCRVNFPGHVKKLAEEALRGCKRLSDIHLHGDFQEIENYALAECSSLAQVDFPDGIHTIGSFALKDCTGLRKVHLPCSLEKLETGIFEGCTSLRHIMLPVSVKKVEEGAFSGCEALKSIWSRNEKTELPENIRPGHTDGLVVKRGEKYSPSADKFLLQMEEHWGEFCIAQIRNIGEKESVELEIPSYQDEIPVTGIGDSACAICPGLRKAVIPENIAYVGVMAFYGDKNLEEVIWEHKTQVPFLDTDALGIGTDTIHYVATREIEHALSRNDYGGIVFTVQRTMGNTTYRYELSEQKMTFQTGPEGLASFNKQEDRPWHRIRHKIKSVEFLIQGAKIGNLAFMDCTELETVYLPSSLKLIGKMAFHGCVKLKYVDFPSSVTEIGAKAFYGCESLGTDRKRAFALPGRLEVIGIEAFFECTGLTELTVPISVSSIGESAFMKCRNLGSVRLPHKKKPKIGRQCFYELKENCVIQTKFSDVRSLEENSDDGTVYPPREGGELRWHFYYDGEFQIDGSGEMKDFDSSTPSWYEWAAEIREVCIGPGITTIGNMAFRNSNAMRITLPEGLECIGTEAFAYCSLLENLEIPSSVNTIRTGAFRGSDGIKRIFIRQGTEKLAIENCVFENIRDGCRVYVPRDVWHTVEMAYSGKAYGDILFPQAEGIVFGTDGEGKRVQIGVLYGDGLLWADGELDLELMDKNTWFMEGGEKELHIKEIYHRGVVKQNADAGE